MDNLNMYTAIVTGGSSGIGLEISKILINNGYYVFAISRNFEHCNYQHACFDFVECDITNTSKLIQTIKKIVKKNPKIKLLVNNAGLGLFGQLETTSCEDIQKMIDTNLTAPIILTRLLLNRLKETNGTIINISSTAATIITPKGTVYSATKAGLLQFGETLFNEVRKNGIRVTTVLPDMTAGTNFYNKSDFEPFSSNETSINAVTVAKAVLNILQQPEGTIITQITIRPQKFRLQSNKTI